MPEEQDKQIERRDPGGISRRSETARRGSDAARFVGGLANRRTESDLPSTVPTGHTYEFALEWGTWGYGEWQFRGPCGIALASDGRVYVVDSINGRIQKFTSEGVFVSKWGTEGTGDGQFDEPYGIAVASDGSVYVADRGNNRVQKFTSEGVFVTKWGSQGEGEGEFGWPDGIAVASDGSVYVADSGNSRIQKFTSEGVFVSKWGPEGTGDGEFSHPEGVAVAYDGSVYVAETGAYRIQGNYRIQKFTSEGVFVSKWGAQGSGDGEFSESLDGVAVASDGSVYVADGGNHRIQQFSPSR